MRRGSFWLAVGALAAGITLLGMAACGGGGGGGDAQPADTSAAADAQPAETAGAPKQGGTLQFALTADTDYNDPALAYYQVSWQIEYATCVKLLNYPDAADETGSQLIPEAADALPEVSADGKTYTFTVTPKYKFSPPSTETVTAETFKFVIERDLNPKMQSPAASFVSDIVGAQEYLDGKADEVSGVKVDGNTLTITLTDVAPDFISRIAMPFFCAIPTDTPIDPKGVKTVAGAGPYYIDSWTPKRSMVLKRNPNYTGDRIAYADEIQMTMGVDQAQASLEIQQGSSDYLADAGPPPAERAGLIAKVGPGSPAAKDGNQQYFVNPIVEIDYMAMNTTRPNFDNVKVRQAVNFALDKPTMSQQSGPLAGTLTDQYLPPAIPGFVDEDLYPLDGPDLERAKQLMAESGVQTPINAVLYTCNVSPCPERAQVVQQNLKAIGIDVEIKQFDRNIQFQKGGIKGEPFDITDEGWFADYPDPYDFLNILLDGSTITDVNNVNFSYFDDPAYNKRLQEAARLSGDERFSTYQQLGDDIARDAAPWAAWRVVNNPDFFSARVGCQIFQPIYSMDYGSFCLKE
jgi:peptide/nickel transport system substrate-binding protein